MTPQALASLARHAFTGLGSVAAWMATRHLITPDQTAVVSQAFTNLIDPLSIIAGALLSRCVIWLSGYVFPGLSARLGGGVSGVSPLLIVGCMACLTAFSTSCSTTTTTATDPTGKVVVTRVVVPDAAFTAALAQAAGQAAAQAATQAAAAYVATHVPKSATLPTPITLPVLPAP